VTPSATGGGLTNGTPYYLNVPSTSTCSYHLTVAAALAGTSKVNLTASITAAIVPSGISSTAVSISPFLDDEIALFNGSSWAYVRSDELSVALGTLTSGLPYDLYGYNNGGVLAAEWLAWTSASARATAIVRQNGVWLKSGDLTRRLLGTIRTDSTTTTIDDGGSLLSQVGAKRFVANAQNQVTRALRVFDSTATWTYSTNTWRQANGAAGNMVEWVNSVDSVVDADVTGTVNSSTNTVSGHLGLNLDTTSGTPSLSSGSNSGVAATAMVVPHTVRGDWNVLPGYHYIAWMETGNGTPTCTFIGVTANYKSGISGRVWI
jgi:hypothetical protein